jgi:hypothetical protein
MKTRAAAALPVWLLVALAGLAGTLAFTAAQASRFGCAGSGTTNVIAVAGIAGFGLAVATLLLVGAVPSYRRAVPALAAFSVLGLSLYAIVSFLTRDGGACF